MKGRDAYMEREPWCSIYEICKYLNCTYYAVKGAIKYHNMPAYKVGKLWRLKKSEVDEWLKTPEAQKSAIAVPTDPEKHQQFQERYERIKALKTEPKTKISYKTLFKMLIDRGIKKKELAQMANISIATVTKMAQGGNVTTDVFERICIALNCKVGDIVEIVPVGTQEESIAKKADNEIKKKSVETPALTIKKTKISEPEVADEHGLFPREREIVHFIYERIHYYKENPPLFMLRMVLDEYGAENPNMTVGEARTLIPTDRYYSLVLNDVFEEFGKDGYAFDKKHIPFSLIESGHFEPDEETFGEITMT